MSGSSILRLGWIALALLMPLPIRADASDIVASIEAKYRGVSTLTAGFTQTTRNAIHGDETQQGAVYFKRPSKMRWEFREDGRQFVTDGSTMWIYTPSDKQVVRFEEVPSQEGSPQSLLQSLDKLNELFEVEQVNGPESITLDLSPRDPGSQFKNLRLILTEQLVIQQVVITDPFDAVTELVFDHVKLDPPVPDKVFQFKVPVGVEVIESGAL